MVEALLKLGYGLYVISASRDGRLNGQIANSLFQITPDPPYLGACINRNNFTHRMIEESGSFGVNALSIDTDIKFIGRFGFRSGRDFDKFEGLDYSLGPRGNPKLNQNTVAFLEVEVTERVEVGTHTIFIGFVTHGEVISDEEPMSYFHYRVIKRGGTPKSASTYYEKKG